MDEEQVLQEIEKNINLYPDCPKPGILFRDIMPVIDNHHLFVRLLDLMSQMLKGYEFDRVIGVEARGFLLGRPLAMALKKDYSSVRKKGKLRGELYSVEYDLEYGKDVLEIRKQALRPGTRCIIVDDLLATGGTVEASKKLVEISGSVVVAVSVVIELKDLKGRHKLGTTPVLSLFSY